MELSFLALGSSAGLFTLIAYVLRLRAEHARLQRLVDTQASPAGAAIDHLPGVTYHRNLDGEDSAFVKLRGEVEELTGYAAGVLTEGSPTFLELVHPEDLEMIRSEILRAVEKKERFRVSYRIRRRDGEWRWMMDQGAAIYSSTGVPTAIEGFLLDVTDRKALEEERVQLDSRYRLLAQHGRDVICLHDRDGRIVYASPSVKRVLGYDPEELRDRNFFVLVHAEQREALRKKIERKVQEDGESTRLLLRIRKRNGRYLNVETTCSPELDDEGYLSRFVTCSSDASALVRSRAELKKARNEAMESIRHGSVAIENMGHELRTPLTGIIGFADLLSENLEAEQQKFVGLIRESGERLLTSVTSLMDYVALEGDAVPVHRDKVNVAEVIGRQVDRYRADAERSDVVLQSVMESDEILAEVDEQALETIASHLIHNAVKFTGEEGVVTIAVREEGEDVVLRIADTGVGIGSGFMPHMFDPFQQESSGLTREYEGIGLGLSITKRLTELHRGRIDVESTKGEGSVFTVHLPKFSPETMRRMREDSRRNTKAHDTGPRLPRKRVLAIDDNQPMRRIIERHLGARYEVVTAANEEEALARVRNGSFDFILIDINLGAGRNGIDVLQSIREVRGFVRVPIVAITAYAMPEERLRFTRAGFDGYVSKPFSQEQLLRELDRLENRARRVERQSAA